jgi:hypothetical protein
MVEYRSMERREDHDGGFGLRGKGGEGEPWEIAEASVARESAAEGIVERPEEGKRYARLVFAEGTIAVEKEAGGRTIRIPNGALIEVDERGEPRSALVRDLIARGVIHGELIPFTHD